MFESEPPEEGNVQIMHIVHSDNFTPTLGAGSQKLVAMQLH